MNHTTARKENSVDISGTSYRGEFRSTFSEIVKIFGEPTYLAEGSGDKSQADWYIRFSDGTIATIYDWKEYRPLGEVTDWHIGGHGQKAVDLVLEAMKGDPEPDEPLSQAQEEANETMTDAIDEMAFAYDIDGSKLAQGIADLITRLRKEKA